MNWPPVPRPAQPTLADKAAENIIRVDFKNFYTKGKVYIFARRSLFWRIFVTRLLCDSRLDSACSLPTQLLSSPLQFRERDSNNIARRILQTISLLLPVKLFCRPDLDISAGPAWQIVRFPAINILWHRPGITEGDSSD